MHTNWNLNHSIKQVLNLSVPSVQTATVVLLAAGAPSICSTWQHHASVLQPSMSVSIYQGGEHSELHFALYDIIKFRMLHPATAKWGCTMSNIHSFTWAFAIKHHNAVSHWKICWEIRLNICNEKMNVTCYSLHKIAGGLYINGFSILFNFHFLHSQFFSNYNTVNVVPFSEVVARGK